MIEGFLTAIFYTFKLPKTFHWIFKISLFYAASSAGMVPVQESRLSSTGKF
jgi:hypothetical protein